MPKTAENVVPMKSRDYRVISQQELREFWQLEQKYIDARDQWRAMTAKFALRLGNGARQEPGKYALRHKTYFRRRIAYKEIVIELRGAKYVDNLLKNAKPTAYTRLEFEDIGSNR